jgi:hypothetical protein
VIVTEVEDQRNSNNKNSRYLARKIHSNVQSSEQVTIVIQESTPIVIGASGGSSGGIAPPQSTAAAQVNPNVVTMDPNSMSALSNSNSTMILPAGVPLPNFGGMQVIQDPAIIIQPNQQVFVEFVDQQQQEASIININAGEAGVTIVSA